MFTQKVLNFCENSHMENNQISGMLHCLAHGTTALKTGKGPYPQKKTGKGPQHLLV
jgi:hypothetical protein